MLRWYRGYLIVVAVGGKMSRQVSSVSGAKDPMTISIYDVQNKFAGAAPIPPHTHTHTPRRHFVLCVHHFCSPSSPPLLPSLPPLPHPYLSFVAYQFTYPCRVVDVLSEWGCILILLKDGKVSTIWGRDRSNY